MQKFSIKCHLKKDKAKKGITPIYIRIYLDGKKTEISTGLSIDIKNWNSSQDKAKSSCRNADLINTYLNRSSGEIERIFLEKSALGHEVTLREIKNTFLKIEEYKEKTIMDAFTYQISKLEEKWKADLIHKATMLRYKATKTKLIGFMKQQYGVEDYGLSKLRLSFITEFEHYLLTTGGLQRNTAHKNLIILKKVIKIAIQLDWLQSNPFQAFQCSYKNPKRVVLTQEELHRIESKKFSIQRLTEVRDVFLFQCYTGFSYTDLFEFDRNAVNIGIDQEYWITTHRKKTGNRESVPLLPIAMKIINQYKGHPECIAKNKLLPVNSNQRYNSYLKEIADLCGINKKITTHIARHTFATTVTLANGVPIETVSKMLGHTKLATTQIYAKVLDQKVSEDMQQLRKKLSTNTENSQIAVQKYG